MSAIKFLITGAGEILFKFNLQRFIMKSYRERHFSQKRWMNCDPAKRYLYMEDFEEKYDVVVFKIIS